MGFEKGFVVAASNNVNVAYVIYNTLGKLNVASKTVSMNIDDLYSTLLLIISLQRFRNTFSAITYHFDTHMLLIPIEKINNERDSFRKAREAHIIHKAKTLEPLGINKRDEL